MAKFQGLGFNAHDEHRPAFREMMHIATHPDKPFEAILVNRPTKMDESPLMSVKNRQLLDDRAVQIISVGN